MSQWLSPVLKPTYETRGPLLLAGLSQRYDKVEPQKFGQQWKRFEPFIGTLAQQAGKTAYGVVIGEGPKSFSYMTTVEVETEEGLPADWKKLRIDAPRYAVFRHQGNVSTLHETMNAIYEEFMPKIASQRADGVSFIERYGPSFDPKTGDGGFDVLVALRA